MKYFKCPHCLVKVEYLDYSQPSREWGSYSLPEGDDILEEDRENGDYDNSDSESDGDTSYDCGECGRSLELSELIFVDEEKEQVKKEGKKIRKKKIDTTIIITPTSTHIETLNPWEEETRLPKYLTCHKCQTEILLTDDDTEINCTKCNTELTIPNQ